MYTRILAPIDGSETSSYAFETALQLARESGAELQPLFVVDVPTITYDASGFDPTVIHDAMVEEGAGLAAAALARMKRENVKGAPRIVEAPPVGDDVAQSILAAANDMQADLVVMGTHGRRGFPRLMLGSVAERFLRLARCPVLMVPAHQAKRTGSHEPAIRQTSKETS